jgi:hypothetical protein
MMETYPKIRDIIAALPGLTVDTAVHVYMYDTIGPNYSKSASRRKWKMKLTA